MAGRATQNGTARILGWLRLALGLVLLALALGTGYSALKADIRQNAADIRHEAEFRRQIDKRLVRIEEKIDDLRDRMPAKTP